MKKISILLLVVLYSIQMSADEGMWMIHASDAALEKKMQERGLLLDGREIYDADAPGAGVADAVVSLDFGCTGSIISDEGLVITNHHCAFSDIHSLSTPSKNYLEDGFWAMRSEEEVHIPGKSIYLLKKVLDVTSEVEELKASLKAEGKPIGMRKISFLLEKKYSKETSLEASLSSYWAGSKYYMALYQVYRDIRLVAAPPVFSAAFGGDIDNWEWPQHKCDFAMYRIYTAPDGSSADYSPENVPLHPVKRLTISLDGYRPGDFTMVIGYPGRTNRYTSAPELEFNEKVNLPVSNSIRQNQMDIIRQWMDTDAAVRLKYQDKYFTLSNIQELGYGEQLCFGRFKVAEQLKKRDAELSNWIRTKGNRMDIPAILRQKYADIQDIERNRILYRETFVRGSNLSLIIRKAFNAYSRGSSPINLAKDYAEIDLRVEKDLMTYALKEYLENVDSIFLTSEQRAVMQKYDNVNGCCDLASLAEDLWNSSLFTCEEGISRLEAGKVSDEEVETDPLASFLMSAKITDFNTKEEEVEGKNNIKMLTGEYKRSLYAMRKERGEMQYPDANSTMRISYGQVCTLEPSDGVICDWKTTPRGILEKYNPASYDFFLPDRLYLLYSASQWGRWGFGADKSQMYVNFLTDNDITGGNSGSPVLNSKGELIGLAFDGNKESLASDALYVPKYNCCVCVDIRFILWTLDRVAGLERILQEIGC